MAISAAPLEKRLDIFGDKKYTLAMPSMQAMASTYMRTFFYKNKTRKSGF